MSGKAPVDGEPKAGGVGAGPEAASPAAGSGDWLEVAEALNTLGVSIGRATFAAVDNEENRRRLRELSEGLASLARRTGESIESVASSPEGEQVKRAVVQAADTVREVGDKAAGQLRPHVLSAVMSANEKFRKAAEQWEPPAKPAAAPGPEPSAEPAKAVADSGADTASAVAPAAPPEAAEVLAAAATPVPSRVFESVPASPDKLDAVRVAHERFVAERKAAETAAAESKAAAGVSDEPVRDESVIGPEPIIESTESGDRPMW